MWPFYIIISAFLLVFILFDYVKNRNFYKKASCIDGPKAYPIIGNLNLFLGRKFTTEAVLEQILNICHLYPSPSRFWIGNHLLIQVYEPEQMKTIFLSPKTLGKSEYYKFARPWQGEGLVVAPVDVWKVHRKIIQPTFNTKVLQSFFEIFKKHSQLLVDELITKYQGKEFDVEEYISPFTLNVIFESAMGVSVSSIKERNTLFGKAAQRAMYIIISRSFKVWLHYDFIFNRTQMGKDFYESVEFMHNITDEVIQKKKRDLQSDNKGKEANGVQKKAFLDLLMELEKGTLTEKEIRDEVSTMIIAGNDTTATVLSFCLLMLASHPEVQDRVYDELYGIYGDDNTVDNPLKHDDLGKMIYLERTIKETLRLFPAAPLILRQSTDDIKIGEHTFPKNSSIMLVITKVHRDERFWPDPLKFDPDRFLPEEVAKRHPYSYCPFAAGPRNCIGLAYAMMSMKVFLATVVRNCVVKKDKIVPVKDIKVTFDVLSKPVDPVILRFEKRISNKKEV